MRLVLGHFLGCRKAGNCQLCQQLLGIVSQHAAVCQSGPASSCPVPMCDAIRAEKKDKEEREKMASEQQQQQSVVFG